MKFSNIFIAYKSSLLGLGITVLTSVYQAVSTGPVNWKALGTAVVSSIILATTDLLKEKQKSA